MIPIPSVHLSSASRPNSVMSSYRPESAMGGSYQTTPSKIRAGRASMDVSMLPSSSRPLRVDASRLPPSSFRESLSAGPGRSPGSRPASRAGAATPIEGAEPRHIYGPPNARDPLDVEFANVANMIGHAFLIERVDAPLRAAPKSGEEIRAQYAFSNALGRKLVTCKLTTMTRNGSGGAGVESRKVLCRVGGGWQDLRTFLLSKQAAL
jgi:hypothetical protein